MNKYRLKGIVYPGTVDIYKIGKVNLTDLPEEKLDELFKDGCPFLELTPEARQKINSNEPEITVTTTPNKKENRKKQTPS